MLFTSPSMECHRNILGVFLLPLIIGQVIETVSSERVTDICVNNKYNKTIIADNSKLQCLSIDQENDLEYKILRFLGLSEKPKNIEKKIITKRSGPKFLYDIYNNKIDYEHWYNNEELELYMKNLYKINQSDVIISFMARQPHKGKGGKPDRVKRMWFNVSAIPVDADNMLSAELRLYRGSNFNIKKYPGAFIVKVGRVYDDDEGTQKTHFVDSWNISAGYTGWIILNVSESLQFWTKNPKENKGLYLSVVSAEGNDSRTIKAENIGIVGFDGEEKRQPFIAGYYKEPEKQKILDHIQDLVTRHPRNAPVYSLDAEHYGKTCGLRELYVNFTDIHWDEWILAPDGFAMSFCSGKCTFPFEARMNVTNHAIIQSLVHQKHPEIPEPCCVPRKYSDLKFLYSTNDPTNILQRRQNMIVNECGCS